MLLGQASMQSTRGDFASYTAIELDDVAKLPMSSEGYAGVDLLVISTANKEFLESISATQAQAIKNWVLNGGHAQVWVGKNADAVKNLDWLSSLVHEPIVGSVSPIDPGMLESYLASQKRLEKLVCAKFDIGDKREVELSLMGTDRKKIPLLFKHAIGFGQVQVFASDLDLNPIHGWADRKILLERLLADHWGQLKMSDRLPRIDLPSWDMTIYQGS